LSKSTLHRRCNVNVKKERKVPKRYLKVRDKLVGSLDIMEEIGSCRKRNWKGMREEAKNLFLKVLDFEPDFVEALTGLKRLGP